MRLIHAVRDINAAGDGRIETVALHTANEARAMFVREADLSYDLGPAAARPYLDLAVLERALTETRRRRGVAGLGLHGRGPHLRGPVRAPGHRLHRPERRGHAQAGRQDRLEAARRGGRCPGGTLEPGRRRHPRERAGQCGRGRIPADAQGDRGGRRPRHPDGGLGRRPGGRLPAHQRRGAAGVRQRNGLPGASGHRRPARRGPADRRRARHCLGPGCARLLDPAAQPEGDRGVRLAVARPRAGRGGQGVGRAPRPGRGVRRRRHRGVPLQPRRQVVRLPRGQHAPAGRALDHRGDHRCRPREGADLRRGRRSPHRPVRRQAGRVRARRRGPAQRRGPRPRLRSGPRPHRPARAARGTRRTRRHRGRRGRHDPA